LIATFVHWSPFIVDCVVLIATSVHWSPLIAECVVLIATSVHWSPLIVECVVLIALIFHMIFWSVKKSRTTGQTNGPGSAYLVVAPEEELENTKRVIRIRISIVECVVLIATSVPWSPLIVEFVVFIATSVHWSPLIAK
jgi:hypothetical protein